MADPRGEEKAGRLFYKTIIRYEVLSEDPIPGDADLAYIATEAFQGRYVGRFLKAGANDHILMNGASMAEALVDAGSEPGFFELDALGFDLPEDGVPYDFE
jgi:hypothetical protein